MKRLFLLFSHKLTEQQVADAKKSLGVEEFVYLPTEIQKLWSSIPPSLDELNAYLTPIVEYIDSYAKTEDIFLVQGDFGACFDIVSYLNERGFDAYYATTSRKTVEKLVEGKVVKTSVFEHVRFRKY
jgi:hypothetical protein